MMEDEAAWLDKDLAAAQKAGKRVVVLMHRPPWDSPYDGQLDVNGKYFMPLFDKYNVPLVFTAHEHCYERTVPIKNDQAATEGTVYIATGAPGRNRGMAPSASRQMSSITIRRICRCT